MFEVSGPPPVQPPGGFEGFPGETQWYNLVKQLPGYAAAMKEALEKGGHDEGYNFLHAFTGMLNILQQLKQIADQNTTPASVRQTLNHFCDAHGPQASFASPFNYLVKELQEHDMGPYLLRVDPDSGWKISPIDAVIQGVNAGSEKGGGGLLDPNLWNE